MIMADGKTLGAATPSLGEKLAGETRKARERIVCVYDKNEWSVKVPIPNPTLKIESQQSEATQVSVRSLGKSTFAVKLEFHRKAEGQNVRDSLELAMRPGEANILNAAEQQPTTLC